MSDGLTYTGPINPDPKPDESSIIIYTYVPSLALGVVGVITFALIFGVNLFYAIKKRGRGYRSFHILILVGAAMEAGGYGARIASHYRPFVVISFILQYFLIVVAPVLFSAAIYLSLTLLTKGFEGADRLLVIRPKLILIFFITADAICSTFFPCIPSPFPSPTSAAYTDKAAVIQVCGAALIGVAESAKAQQKSSPVTPKQANDILLAGLACQCFSFSTFLLILCGAIYRARQPGFPGPGIPTRAYKQLRLMMWVILVTSDLILLRTVFRLAETGQGFFGFASTHEWLFAILEYLPVIAALIVWAAFPPSRFLEKAEIQRAEQVAEEEKRAQQTAQREAGRQEAIAPNV